VERDREKYEVNEEITVKLMEGSPRSEKTHGGQNLRRSSAVEVEERRHWRRLKASQLDSLQEDGEDDEAHPSVPSGRWGMDGSVGAMVVCEVFSSLVYSQRKREDDERSWRREGGRWERARVSGG
jgi:hypothetical protein